MDVRLPDGTVIQNVPDNMSKADLAQKLKANGYQGDLETSSGVPSLARNAMDFAQAAGHHLMNLPHGAAQLTEQIAGGLAQRIAPDSPIANKIADIAMKDDEAMAERERQYQAKVPNSPGAYAGAVTGSVLPFMVGGAASKIANPELPASMVASAIPRFIANTAAGAGTGALAGATAPVTDTSDLTGTKTAQMAGGAILGAAAPTAIALVKALAKGAYNIAEPFLPGQGTSIRGREYLNALGDKAKPALAELQSPKELVPGSLPTAGEAVTPVGSAEFSALQKSASKVLPSKYVERGDQQAAARVNALRQFAGTPKDLATAESERAATSKLNYDQAFKVGLSADKDLSEIANNPYVKGIMPKVLKSVEARGLDPFKNPADRTEFLQLVKVSLDKELSKAGDDALSSAQKSDVQSVKTKLLSWLETHNPSFEMARSEHARMSEPINQMQIGQYLEGKLTPALNEFEEGAANQRAQMFANALREAPTTIKKSTGQPMYSELSQVLTPEQINITGNVAQDLGRKARFETLAKAGSQSGPSAIDIASRTMERPIGGPVPNMLSRPMMIANALIRRLEGKANDKIAMQMAQEMLNPQEVANTIQLTMNQQTKQKMLADLLRKAVNAGTLAGIQEQQ